MRILPLCVVVAAVLGCGSSSPSEPRLSCDGRIPNVKYDIVFTGEWKSDLLAQIAAVPDSQTLEVAFSLSRMPTSSDSIAIVEYGGRPNWYWVSTGRSPLGVTIRADDLRRFLAEVSLDYVFTFVIPGRACPLQ